MRVRGATIEDFDQLIVLYRELNPADPDAKTEQQVAFEKILRSDSFQIAVAERDGAILSSCYLNIVPNLTRGGRPYAVIENVITDSNHRKEGLGSAVIDWAVSRAWERDCYKVMLMSGRSDPMVHDFYKSCGFNSAEKQAYVQRAP